MAVQTIKRLFVLMLENRSYDNIFGWSDIRGWTPDGSPTQAEGLLGKPEFVNRDRRGIPYTVGVGASFQLTFDPGHEFSDVLLQLCGPTSVSAANCLADSANLYSDEYPPIRASANDFGFAACLDDHGYDVAAALRCFTPDQLPVLNFLAHQFAVCDHWFSSMPGPTWPNRFFSLAGTSWGLDHSPSDLSALTSNFLNSERFGNGSDSILTRLAPSEWMVVAGDHAQSWALAGVEKYPHNFVAYSSFSQLLNEKSGFLPRYVFVEPAYDALPMSSFRKGNSMHPLGDVRLGEMLIKEVYETLKASAYWEESALLVLFDEHGGFFDHVIPGKCASPMPQGPRDDLTKHNFGFNQCGFRVPALVISPYVRQSTIDHTVYDHSSILKTAGALLRPPPAQPLITNSRISAANSFEKLFSLTVPRHRDDIPPCPPAVPIPNGSLPRTGRTGRSVDAFQTLPVYRGAA